MTNLSKFITFEGGEGGGKSTQSKLLLEAFKKSGITAIHTREPGGTKGAEKIRELLVTGEVNKWDAMTEALLHFAARYDHLSNFIYPQLELENFVICDRFSDSTISYQGYGYQLGLEKMLHLQKQVIGDFQPDLTFILDIDIEHGISRASNRGDNENRYEKIGKEFHLRVRKGFLEIAKKDPERCFLINADDTIENIHQQIIDIINEKFSLYLESLIV
jgi:dTMP kinase